MLVDTKPTIFTCGHQPCHVCELWLRNYIPARNFNVSFSISCFSHNYSGSFLSIFLANVFVVTLLIWVLYINICIFLLLFLEYFFSSSLPVLVLRCEDISQYICLNGILYVHTQNHSFLFVIPKALRCPFSCLSMRCATESQQPKPTDMF